VSLPFSHLPFSHCPPTRPRLRSSPAARRGAGHEIALEDGTMASMGPGRPHRRVAPKEATPSRWLLVLHGIFGSGRNWGSIARRLVEARPEWGAVLVDLRLHGQSREGFGAPHTMA